MSVFVGFFEWLAPSAGQCICVRTKGGNCILYLYTRAEMNALYFPYFSTDLGENRHEKSAGNAVEHLRVS